MTNTTLSLTESTIYYATRDERCKARGKARDLACGMSVTVVNTNSARGYGLRVLGLRACDGDEAHEVLTALACA